MRLVAHPGRTHLGTQWRIDALRFSGETDPLLSGGTQQRFTEAIDLLLAEQLSQLSEEMGP